MQHLQHQLSGPQESALPLTAPGLYRRLVLLYNPAMLILQTRMDG